MKKFRFPAFQFVPFLSTSSAKAVLVSYPKSGRTWLRVIMNDLGLRIDATHDGSDHRKQIPWQELTFCGPDFRGKRVIFLHRNPMDTVVSGYFQTTRRIGNFEGDISSFIRDPRYGMEKILQFNIAWFQQRQCRDLLLVSYENMKSDDLRSVGAILDFLGVRITAERLEKAVKDARFENLKSRESTGSLSQGFKEAMQPGDINDPESYKVRKGVVEGYREYLSPEDIAYCQALLEAYEYASIRDRADAEYGIDAKTSAS